MQEAFLNALRRPPADQSGLLTWLGVLARHEAIRGGIREDHRRQREQAVAAAEGYLAETAESLELKAEVRRVLENLPDPYREVLQLRYVDELEIDEIAERLGRSRGTVGSQIKRGLDRLRERLVPQEKRRGLRGLVLLLLGREGRPYVRWTSRAALVCVCAVALVPLWWEDETSASSQAAEQPPSEARVAALESPSSGIRQAAPLPRPIPPAEASVAPPAEAVDSERSAWLTSVHGLVLGPDEVPLAGASLRVGEDGEAPGRVVGISDEAGRFQLDGLDGRLWLWADGERRRCSKQHLLATTTSGRELVLRTGETVDARRGRLLNAEGVPIAGAKITLLDSGSVTKPWLGDQGTIERVYWPYRHTVVTAPDGTFAFGLSADDRSRMLIEADGEAPEVLVYFKAREEPCTDFCLPRGGAVRGRVLDAEGSPVPGAPVRLKMPGTLVLDTVAGERGEFAFDAVPFAPYELVASHPLSEALSARLAGDLKHGANPTRDIFLSEAGTLRGIVLTDGLAEGQPGAGWSVELERLETEFFLDRRLTTSADDGRFAFASCLPGAEYRLSLRAPDSAHLNWAGRVRMGDSPEFSLRVRAAEWKPSRLEGILGALQPEDSPFFLELWSDALMSRWMARVDPLTGRYSFDGVPPGEYELLGWTKRCGPVEVGHVSLEPGRVARLDATLRAPGTLRVRVEVPADVQADRVDVVLFAPSMQGSTPYGMRPMSPGGPLEFLAEMPPGEHEYRVRIDKQIFDVRRAQMREGEVTEELVTIPPFVSVVFRMGLPRSRLDWHDPKVVARGEREWHPSRSHTNLPKERLPVRLARDVTEVEVWFEAGLHGVWRGQLETVKEATELLLPLEEHDAAPR